MHNKRKPQQWATGHCHGFGSCSCSFRGCGCGFGGCNKKEPEVQEKKKLGW